MSFWFNAKKADISFSKEGDEMHIWLEQDEFGNVYASVNVEDVKQALKENEQRTTKAEEGAGS